MAKAYDADTIRAMLEMQPPEDDGSKLLVLGLRDNDVLRETFTSTDGRYFCGPAVVTIQQFADGGVDVTPVAASILGNIQIQGY